MRIPIVLALAALSLTQARPGVAQPLVGAIDDGGGIYGADFDPGSGAFDAARRLVGARGDGARRGLAIGDFDGDGDLDLVAGAASGSRIWYHVFPRGADGTHRGDHIIGDTSRDAAGPMDMAAGDIDHDGHLDVVGNVDGQWVFVWLGDGNGGFRRGAELDLGPRGRGLDLADVDRDGHLDLVRGRSASGYVDYAPGAGDGTFGPAVRVGDAGTDPYGVVAGDFDGDGFVDVIANAGADGAATLWRGNGDGTFRAGVAAPSLDQDAHGAFDAVDVDGDGDLDVIACDDAGRRLRWFAGNGDGTFAAPQVLGATADRCLGVAAPPLPTPGGARSVVDPPAASVPVGVPLALDGSGSLNAARFAWAFEGADGSAGDGGPGVVEHAFGAEGLYPVTLTTWDAAGQAHVARVPVAALGEAPVIDATPIQLGEESARDGRWSHTLDVAALVDEDVGLTSHRWSALRIEDGFEGGVDRWWLREGAWAIEADAPLGGAASLRQTDAAADRSRVLYPDFDYDGDIEVEFDVRMVAGDGQEIRLLLDAIDIDNGFEVALRGRGLDEVAFHRRSLGVDYPRVAVPQPEGSPLRPIATGRTYHVRVTRVGDRTDVWVDGRYAGGHADALFKGGRVGLSTWRTDAIFDDFVVREIGSDAVFAQTWRAPGAYAVELSVADGAGQVDVRSIPVIVAPGAPPEARAVSPATFDEITGAALAGVYTATLDGTASSDPEGSRLTHVWDLGTETFDGQGLDSDYWMGGGVTQDGALRAVGTGGWGQRSAFTRGAFDRARGFAFEARVNATGRMMVGLKNTTDSGHANQYIYALYFNNGGLQIYESGSNRGTRAPFLPGVDYDVRIEVDPTVGARYLYRRSGGDGIWREVYVSGHSREARFRIGFDVREGAAMFDDWRRLVAGRRPVVQLPGPATYDGTLTVYDTADNTDSTPARLVLLPGAPPVADAGGDRAFGEAEATGGRWTVVLDGGASTDDHGILRHEWDFAYDPEAGFVAAGAGAVTAHVFTAGAHRVALRVTDHARQTAIDVITVTLTPGAPPVADPGPPGGGPYVFDEFTGDAIGGGFEVTLDGRASSDAESALRWLWDFGTETFAGGYNPEKWVMFRDNTRVEALTPPADPCAFEADDAGFVHGRRLRHVCPAGCAPAGDLWGAGVYRVDSPVCLAAMHAGLIEPGGAGVVDYRIRGFEPGFAGGVAHGIESAEAPGGDAFEFVTGAETGLHLGNTGNAWGTRWAYASQPVVRGRGAKLEMRVRTSGDRAVFGLRVDDADRSYRSMHHGIGFIVGDVSIHEGGVARGDTGYDVEAGVDYDLRIELRARGATYAIKRADEARWTHLYDSDYSAAAALHPAVDVYSGSVVIERVSERVAGPQPSWRLFGTGDHTVGLTVTDEAEQSDSAEVTVRLRGNAPPVARAGDDRAIGEAEAEQGGWAVDFDGGLSTDDHGIHRYAWDFDYDGETFDVDASGVEARHTFVGPGAHTVALRVTDHALQTHVDTLVVDHRGGAPPIANAGQNRVTEGIWPVAFDGSRSTDDVAIARFEWDFGDGSTGVGARPRHTYWAPGVYRVTLTVYDRAGQSDTDTLRVVVRIASDPPVAEAGGPYLGGAGGPPAHFDAGASADDFGLVKHLWDVDLAVDSDGDGDPANDVDAVGPRPMWTYAEVGEYAIGLTVVDGAGQTATDRATVEIAADRPPEVVAVPWVGDDPRARHHIISGRPVRLKAIARDAGPLTHQWDFGDGTPPQPAEPAPVARADAIEITHTYPDAPVGSPFVATLTVWDAAGASSSDIYPLVVQPDDLDTETNIAIEEALWWLHKAQRDDGHWETDGYLTATTASAVHAFVLHGHDPLGDLRENPYVETAAEGFRFLFGRLRAFDIAGDASDSDRNGLAIDTHDSLDPYQMGMAMDALASTNQPLYYAPSGGDGIRHRFFYALVRDMADAYAWGQANSGGWYYDWNTAASDNSTSQWGAIGLIAAWENFRIPIPQAVRDHNLRWLNATASATGFGYTGVGSGTATTPSGMIQLLMNRVSTDDPLWTRGEDWLAGRWQPQTDNAYSVFAQVKALRLGRVERLRRTGLDWFDDPVDGLRRRLIDHRLAPHGGADWGRWSTGIGWVDDEMATAWGVVMLTPTLFQQPPVADAGPDVTWAFDVPLPFDGSGSTHRDRLRQVVKYEWDFDGDGIYDLTTADPRDPRAVFTYPDPQPDVDGDAPRTYYARLRVTDDNVPPQTDTDVRAVTVKDPPYAPIAHIGGPYVVAAGVPFELDASASFDLDPDDRVVRYQWDLTEQGPFFEAVDVDTDAPRITHVMPSLGRYVIGLRVEDTGRFNPPGCAVDVDCVPQRSLPVFTVVEVVDNRPPVPAIAPFAALDEGGALRIDARPTADPEGGAMDFEWTCDGLEPAPIDGADGRVIELDAGGRDFPAGGQAFDCALTVTDVAGARGRLPFTVVGINRPPVVHAVRGGDGVEGGVVVIDIEATDPAPADAERLIYSVDCDGDGIIDVFDAIEPRVTCRYPDDGTYVVAAVVDDDDGGQAVGHSAPVVIANRPPSIEAPPCPAAVEGAPLTVQLVTADPAGAADPVLCRLVPPVPDGARLDAAACRLSWTPTYEQAAAGEVAFAVRALDDDGGVAEARLLCRPAHLDEDGDGLPDAWERDNGLDPTVDDCAEGLDADGDGIDNCAEYAGGTDPHGPDETTPPALLDPVDGVRVEAATPELIVGNARDSLGRALRYEFAVYADDAPDAPLQTSDLVAEAPETTAWIVADALAENAAYRWTARAFNGDGYGPWAPAERFVIDVDRQPPSPPTIAWPADGDAIAALELTLVLDAARDPDPGDTLRYRCEVAFDGVDFAPVTAGAADGADGGPQIAVPIDGALDENAAYRARCRAVDQTGLESGWSNTPRFTINRANDPPTAPAIVAPRHTATVADLEPTLVAAGAVDPEGEALTYVFSLSADPTFPPDDTWTSAPVPEGGGQTAWSAPEALRDDTVYFWRVRARDPFVGGPDASARFRVDLGNAPPSAPVGLDPTDGIGLRVMRPLVWSASVDPDGDPVVYDVALDSAAGDLSWTVETPESSVEYPGELPPGPYVWQVRARDDRDGQSPWSEPNLFTLVQIVAPDPEPDPEPDPDAEVDAAAPDPGGDPPDREPADEVGVEAGVEDPADREPGPDVGPEVGPDPMPDRGPPEDELGVEAGPDRGPPPDAAPAPDGAPLPPEPDAEPQPPDVDAEPPADGALDADDATLDDGSPGLGGQPGAEGCGCDGSGRGGPSPWGVLGVLLGMTGRRRRAR